MQLYAYTHFLPFLVLMLQAKTKIAVNKPSNKTKHLLIFQFHIDDGQIHAIENCPDFSSLQN